jgi:hypothetical protein
MFVTYLAQPPKNWTVSAPLDPLVSAAQTVQLFLFFILSKASSASEMIRFAGEAPMIHLPHSLGRFSSNSSCN